MLNNGRNHVFCLIIILCNILFLNSIRGLNGYLSTLKAFWEESPQYRDAQDSTLAWYRHAEKADWMTPDNVKADFDNASILKDGRVVFNISDNKYRLIVWINYDYKVIYIRFIGTHKQYDNIDAQTI